jgi:hypothetical protein
MTYTAIASSYDPTTLEAAQTHLAAIQSQLPARRALTPKQRQALASLGDKNLAFVSQAVELCATNLEIPSQRSEFQTPPPMSSKQPLLVPSGERLAF